MMPGEIHASPPPVTEQLSTCMVMLRRAREEGDPDREWALELKLDRLLVRYARGQR